MSLPETRVYAYLLQHYQAGIEFAINVAVKKRIAIQFKLAIKTVDYTLFSLKAKTLLYSSEKTMYGINPRYAFRGSTSERKKILETIFELQCKDC